MAGMTSSEISPLPLMSPKDLLPVALEVLPVLEKNLPLISSAPSPTPEAGSIPNGQEQEVRDLAEGTITELDHEQLPTGLSESNGLELPPSLPSDEPLQEADRTLEELVEVQTPTSSPEKSQELATAEITAPSTSSSVTSSPEGPSPVRPLGVAPVLM